MKPETNTDIASGIESPAAADADFIDAVVKRYERDEGMLIPMLQDIQAEYGYLPADHLRCLSRMLKVPLSRIYSVATFYASFRLSPKGQHDVTLCMGTVCYLKGSARISEVICGEYGVEPGGTTKDRLFTLNLVNCVGACALAPVMIVDGTYHAAMTPESALKILRGLSSGEKAESDTERSESTTAEGEAVEKKAAEPAAPKAGNGVKSEAGPGARRTSSGKAASQNASGIRPAADSKKGSKKKTGKR